MDFYSGWTSNNIIVTNVASTLISCYVTQGMHIFNHVLYYVCFSSAVHDYLHLSLSLSLSLSFLSISWAITKDWEMLNCCFIYPNLTLVSVTTPTTNYNNVSTIAFLKLLCVEERTLIPLLSSSDWHGRWYRKATLYNGKQEAKKCWVTMETER